MANIQPISFSNEPEEQELYRWLKAQPGGESATVKAALRKMKALDETPSVLPLVQSVIEMLGEIHEMIATLQANGIAIPEGLTRKADENEEAAALLLNSFG